MATLIVTACAVVWLSVATLAFAACMLASRVDQDQERCLSSRPESRRRAAA